jgi:acyl-coenzyme A synthetase/AMP-(fatty) acid ligase
MLSIHDQGRWPPCPSPFNLAEHALGHSAARLPDKIALQIIRPQGAERWSYRRLQSAVLGCGSGLLALGLAPGDRILMRLGNGVEFPILFLGAIAAGLVPVPTSATLTVPEITRMAETVAPQLIVAAPGLALPDPLPCPVISQAEFLAMQDLPPCDWAMGDPDRLAYIVFTSGTSGRAQAVGHAHRALWARGMMHQGWEGLTESDRLLHAGAFNWTFTLGTGLLDPWTVGATALIPANSVTPVQLPLLMKRFDATIFAAAPGVYRQMLRAPMPPLSRLRHGLSAGEAMAASVRNDWHTATGTPVYEALGMSECSTFVSASPDTPAPDGTSGYGQQGRRLAVLDDTGTPVPRGEPGILSVDRRDPGLMLGYVGDEAATRARFSGDWFLTGDTVSMAPDGAITYLGRADDMMNAGGFRVSPIEVEAAFHGFPGMIDCAVTEVEIVPGTRIITCFYISDSPLDEGALSVHSGANLARWKQPRQFIRLAALPRGANNKLNRRALAALAPKEGI